MGYRAVAAALDVVNARDLTFRQAKLLIHMANQCRDDDRPRRYFGGHEGLAWALGYRDVPTVEEARKAEEAGDDGPSLRRRNRLRTARKVLADLRTLDLVVLDPSKPHAPGKSAEYFLLLDDPTEAPREGLCHTQDVGPPRGAYVEGGTEALFDPNIGPFRPRTEALPEGPPQKRTQEIHTKRAGPRQCRECRRPFAAAATPDDLICRDCRKDQPA